ERQRGEAVQERDREPALRERRREYVVERPRVVRAGERIDAEKDVLRRSQHFARGRSGPDDERQRVVGKLVEGYVQRRPHVGIEAELANVADYAGDRPPPIVAREMDSLPYRIVDGPILARERPVDEGNRRSIPSIRLLRNPSAQRWDAHRLEPAGRHDANLLVGRLRAGCDGTALDVERRVVRDAAQRLVVDPSDSRRAGKIAQL